MSPTFSSPGEALHHLLETDLLHQNRYGTHADRSHLDWIILDAFEAYIRGDKTVDVYELQAAIAQQLRRRNKVFLGRPLQWNSLILSRWHRQFRNGRPIVPMTEEDRRARVTALLAADLWPFETRNTSVYKQQLKEVVKS